MANDRTLLGILYMVGFCLLAPIMDAFAKATPAEIPAAQIITARFVLQIVLLAPLAVLMGNFTLPDRRSMGLHFARAASLLLATWLFFTAIREMPLASAISIFFVEPFVLTILGALFLKEEVGMRRIMACVVGFGGALLIIQPSFSNVGPVALFPLGTAVCFASYMILTRMISQKLHPVTTQLHTAVAASILIAPVLWYYDGSGVAALDPVWPQGLAIWTLLGVGVMATISHISITFALRHAPAATLAPLQYLEIVSATAVGYYIFDELPNGLTWMGIAIIVVSGLYVFARERARDQKLNKPTPPR
ncbi:DMT family transporter [Donghicola sp. XS_ASV15]|uniref:DMT family transporter n=1 Tax=Donghicola sp. XS_ASV15 TaxID=3241295 RepID=UPI0035131E98